MSKTVKVHGMMSMLSGMQIPPNNTEFPDNPGLGQVHSSGNSIYVYTEVAGFQTWFPLVRGADTATYLHTQIVAKLTWNVTHNLGTSDVWFIIKDSNGDYQSPLSVAPDDTDPLNKMIVTFAEPEAGTMFIVGSKAFSTVKMNVSVLNVANTVEIDSSGFSINGTHIDLTALSDAGLLSAQITSEINRAIAAEDALSASIAAETTRATTAESVLSGRIDTLAAASTSTGDTLNSLGNVSGNVALNFAAGTYVSMNVTGPATLGVVSNVPDATHAYAMTLEITNGGTNVTFPNNISWLGGNPTLRAASVNIVTLITRNGGATWLGMVI